MNSLLIERNVINICSQVENSPAGRLNIRKSFYLEYGFSKLSKFGYGQSEIDFIEWEIKRGVLNGLNDKRTTNGSNWWRKMNMQIIYDSEYARLLLENNSTRHVSNSINNWLNYLKKPNSKSWYRAHNSSVMNAFFKYNNEIDHETIYEKEFIKNVLLRV